MENRFVARDQRMEEGSEGVSMTIKWQHKADLCGETALYLDCGGGHTDVHMGLNGIQLSTYHAYARLLVLILHCSYVKMESLEETGKGYRRSLYYLCNFLRISNISKLNLLNKFFSHSQKSFQTYKHLIFVPIFHMKELSFRRVLTFLKPHG